MLMFAKIIDEKTKRCEVGPGTNAKFYKSIGFSQMEVEQAYDGCWYLAEYCPEKPTPTDEEQRKKRAEAYRLEKDPITCQINSLRDEEQTEEVLAEIESLKQERANKVAEIKAKYPYANDDIEIQTKGVK